MKLGSAHPRVLCPLYLRAVTAQANSSQHYPSGWCGQCHKLKK
nr:MAG TPA: Thioredoxin-like domain [Bacteriophage sp.]